MFTANSPTAELQTLYVYVQFHHRRPAQWLGHQEDPSAEEPARRYGTGSRGRAPRTTFISMHTVQRHFKIPESSS